MPQKVILYFVMALIYLYLCLFSFLLIYRNRDLLQSLLELYPTFELLPFFLYFGLVSIYERSKLNLNSTVDRRSSHLIELFIPLLNFSHVLLLVCFDSIVVYFCWNPMIFLKNVLLKFRLLLKLFKFFLNLLKFWMKFVIL